jgi:DNA repair protein RadC
MGRLSFSPSALGDLYASSDAELVALFLARQSSSRAQRLLEAACGLGGVAELGAQALTEQCGLTRGEALRVAAALELGRRAELARLAERPTLGSFDSVVEWARPRLAAFDHEEVWLLSLDGRNGLKAARRVAQGGLHGCALTVRDVLRPALRDGASAILLVHNHPSGDPGASPEDVAMTRALAVACDVVGVPLLDHVIVARGGASSLFELGALDFDRNAA